LKIISHEISLHFLLQMVTLKSESGAHNDRIKNSRERQWISLKVKFPFNDGRRFLISHAAEDNKLPSFLWPLSNFSEIIQIYDIKRNDVENLKVLLDFLPNDLHDDNCGSVGDDSLDEEIWRGWGRFESDVSACIVG
jgi:hypothetical protein